MKEGVKMIDVLIVEDDPMVAQLNKQFLEKIEGFNINDIAHNIKDATVILQCKKVDLVLLDVYLPDESGLTLLNYIRQHQLKTDAILITAASDIEKVQAALHYGVVDYLIKPFEFERFEQALVKYKNKFQIFNQCKVVDQTALDEALLNKSNAINETKATLPKGLTQSTLHAIVNNVNQSKKSEFSTAEIAEVAHISRVSVRKYLKFLVEIDILEESLTYGIGRPVYLYKFKKKNINFLQRYISIT